LRFEHVACILRAGIDKVHVCIPVIGLSAQLQPHEAVAERHEEQKENARQHNKDIGLPQTE
jgi:hypothetical protein